MPILGRALLDALRAHGTHEIFGIPSDFVLPFLKAIEESGTLPFYTFSHEPAVGFAADAAARFHGGISVAVATWDAGAFNLVNPIAGAYAGRVPVVIISDTPGVRAGRGFGPCPRHAGSRFQPVDVMLPRGQTSDTLARFVAGLKAARERPHTEET